MQDRGVAHKVLAYRMSFLLATQQTPVFMSCLVALRVPAAGDFVLVPVWEGSTANYVYACCAWVGLYRDESRIFQTSTCIYIIYFKFRGVWPARRKIDIARNILIIHPERNCVMKIVFVCFDSFLSPFSETALLWHQTECRISLTIAEYIFSRNWKSPIEVVSAPEIL